MVVAIVKVETVNHDEVVPEVRERLKDRSRWEAEGLLTPRRTPMLMDGAVRAEENE
jgi:hypothetical protein